MGNNIFEFFSVRETHQLAEAQQEKNQRLREAFGIPSEYVDGSLQNDRPDNKKSEKIDKSPLADNGPPKKKKKRER